MEEMVFAVAVPARSAGSEMPPLSHSLGLNEAQPSLAQPLGSAAPMTSLELALQDLAVGVTVAIGPQKFAALNLVSKVQNVLQAAQEDCRRAHQNGIHWAMQVQTQLEAQLNNANEQLALANKKLYEANQRCLEMKKANATLLQIVKSRKEPVHATRVPPVMLTMLQTLKNVEHSGLQCYDCSTLNGIEPISFSFDSAMVTGGADPCGSIASESEDLAFDGAVMMTGDMEPQGSIMSESEGTEPDGANSFIRMHDEMHDEGHDEDTDDIADIFARQIKQKRCASQKMSNRWNQVFKDKDKDALEKCLAVFIFDQLADSELFPRSEAAHDATKL